MASLQSIKKRIKSVKAVNKITSAMELAAATKMRRAQETAINSLPYAFTALEMLANIIEALRTQDMRLSSIPLRKNPEIKARAVLLVASDKGLAGTFNSAVFRKFEQFAAQHLASQNGEKQLVAITVGQKAEDYARRRGLTFAKSFTRHGDTVSTEETKELSEFLIQSFTSGEWDSLIVFSTNFVSALKQDVISRELLPIDFQKIREGVNSLIPKTGRYSNLRERIETSRPEKPTEYIIEPSPKEVLEKLVPTIFKMQIYHIILESNASEHSARRMAMKNASDNAKDLVDELSTIYNRARQEQITKEILEITGGAKALAG